MVFAVVPCARQSIVIARMDTFDVVVIGAGPAGSSAAIRLARNGARVALVDRAQFPRDKPCGGGVTVRGLQHLPVDITPVVEDRSVAMAKTLSPCAILR